MRDARVIGLAWVALSACGTHAATMVGDAGDAATLVDGDVLPPVGDANTTGCADDAKLVYVVSTQNDLWRFNPGTLAFTKVGTLDCPTTSTPESMAIDRSARAYVAMMDGNLFQVDTATAHCAATGYTLEQSQRKIFDLSFSRTSATSETLFTSTTCCWSNGGVTVTNQGGGGLATLAVPSLKLALVGDYTGALAGYPAALAGTGDGRLFGMFPNVNQADGGAAPMLAQIDETTGATSAPIVLSSAVQSGSAFAFSFWGGDFWFYAGKSGGQSSTVTRFRYSTDKSYSMVIADTGMTIIGAGVSTCAPLVAPN